MEEVVVDIENMLDERIADFLSTQTILSIAVNDPEMSGPYCANCFYAFEKKANLLVFKSKEESEHITIALKNPNVAGTITPDVLDKTRIRGIQFTGTLSREGTSVDKHDEKAKAAYYKKYPFALAVSGDLWVVELLTLKYTDNKFGFGKRMEWKRSA
jgi:hypothetical protein